MQKSSLCLESQRAAADRLADRPCRLKPGYELNANLSSSYDRVKLAWPKDWIKGPGNLPRANSSPVLNGRPQESPKPISDAAVHDVGPYREHRIEKNDS